jgi:hypothetical protein
MWHVVFCLSKITFCAFVPNSCRYHITYVRAFSPIGAHVGQLQFVDWFATSRPVGTSPHFHLLLPHPAPTSLKDRVDVWDTTVRDSVIFECSRTFSIANTKRSLALKSLRSIVQAGHLTCTHHSQVLWLRWRDQRSSAHIRHSSRTTANASVNSTHLSVQCCSSVIISVRANVCRRLNSGFCNFHNSAAVHKMLIFSSLEHASLFSFFKELDRHCISLDTTLSPSGIFLLSPFLLSMGFSVGPTWSTRITRSSLSRIASGFWEEGVE